MISQNNFVVLEVKQNLRRYWLMAWDIISAAIKTFFDRVPNFNISSFQNLFLRWRLNRSFWGKVRMILAAPENMPMTPNILGSVCCISQIPNNWGLGFFISQIPKLKISDIWSKLCEFREFSTTKRLSTRLSPRKPSPLFVLSWIRWIYIPLFWRPIDVIAYKFYK